MGSLWNRSGMVERYADDLRASGAKAFFFSGGTTTPLTVFQDSGEAAAHPHPVVADANGRWPDVFVPYITSYDVQVKTADGVQLTYSLQIPNPNPVDVSTTVPLENTVQTGMIHAELGNTTKAGYVRLNGKTIGSSASSITNAERANDDTFNLYKYLWLNLPNSIAPVSGGRGGTPESDFFTSNKTLTLPNCQGALLMGLDDMGATAGNFFSGLSFAVGSSTIAGSLTGTNGLALTTDNMPQHRHTGGTSFDGAHTHTGTTGIETSAHSHTGTTTVESSVHVHDYTRATGISVTSANFSYGTGGAAATSPTFLTTASLTTANTLTSGELVAGTDPDAPTSATHTHSFNNTTAILSGETGTGHTHVFDAAHPLSTFAAHNHTFTTDYTPLIGGSTPFNNLPRSVLVTWYIKL